MSPVNFGLEPFSGATAAPTIEIAHELCINGPTASWEAVKKFTIASGRCGKSAYSGATCVEVRANFCSGADNHITRIAELESGLEVTTLFAACLTAMIAVFILLGLLALTMELITAVFPARGPSVEAAIIAAITTTVASIFPGARVTRIEEDS